MGIDTYFRVWRRFNKKTGSTEEIAALREQYKLRNAADDYSADHDKNEEEHARDMPILLARGFKADVSCSSDEDCDPKVAFGNEDGKTYFHLASFFFGRSLGELRDYYNLNSCKRSRYTSFVPRDDVKKIVQAARYLLGGNYSDETEALLENDFIKALGETYPRWSCRKSKANEKIYIDKNDGGWMVSFGDPEGDREIEEENASAEWLLKKLECCLAGALEIETSYDGDDDIVFEICAF